MATGSILERLSGKLDDGCYVTIGAAARHLGVCYRQAQRMLLEAYRAGDLRRKRLDDRRLIYTSSQLPLQLFPAGTKVLRPAPRKRAAAAKRVDDSQRSLF